jgi:hypothetical protein
MDPAAVEAASTRLDPSGVEWVSYICQLSGEKEAVLLIGNDLASRLTKSLLVAEDVDSTKILAGLYSAELCECDVATLTGLSEGEVVSRLRKFAALGVVAHRKVHAMNYYRLKSAIVRRTINNAIESSA